MMGEWAEEIEKNKIRRNALKEGHDSGFSEGVIKNSLDVAKKMLAKNMSVEDISELTDLSIKEIKQLKKLNQE